MVLKTTDEFIAHLRKRSQSTTVIAASARLARRLQEAFAVQAHAQGASVWETPDILPWRAFCAREVERLRALSDHQTVALTLIQERAVWRQIVAEREEAWLGGTDQLADLANGAWSLLADYNLPLPPKGEGPESDLFCDLARAFTRGRRDARQEERARDPHRLAEAYRRGQLGTPESLIWYGFTALTPAQEVIFQTIRANGKDAQLWPVPVAPSPKRALAFSTFEEETVSALSWAEKAMKRDPQGHFALIVPDLSLYQPLLTRLAEDMLEEGTYAFASGAAIAETPIVRAALRLIESACGGIATTDAASLVQSPFFAGYAEEAGDRWRAAYKLGQEPGPMDVSEIAIWLSEADVPGFTKVLHEVAALRRRWPRAAAPSAWAQAFSSLIKQSGWHPTQGHGQERVQEFDSALTDMATLDAIVKALSPQRALEILREELAGRQISPPPARLDILAPADAAGESFDGVWIMNLTDEAWPRMGSPHPLLPWRWQRQRHLPNASPIEQMDRAERLMTTLFGGAEEVIVSFAESHEDQICRPSAILRKADPVVTASGPFITKAERIYRARPNLQVIEDANVPATHMGPYGAGLLEAQARCPFRAFAEYRLDAHAAREPKPGVQPGIRGSILHKALEYLFVGIPDSATLAGLDERVRREMARVAVERAMSRRAFVWHHMPRRYRALEQSRLTELLLAFLQCEDTRSSFHVRDLEREITLRLGPLQLRGRVDRIDEAQGQGLVLIDYKTGSLPSFDLEGERPRNPQLLIYALAVDGVVDALVYASLSAAGVSYRSVGAMDLVPGIKTRSDWAALTARWPAIFQRLADDFLAGDARVDPDRDACSYCGRESLCRVGMDRTDDDD